MAITGVMRPGHIQLRQTDLEAGIHFYREIIGLIETGRDSAGRVYFKCWDERDHNSIILRQADTPGMDFLGFKVSDVPALDQLEADLNAYGVKTERIPSGEMLETGERVRFEIPTGHLIELYSRKADVGNGMPYVNPDMWTKESEQGMAPVRFDHAMIAGPNLEGSLKIFTEVLGFYVTERILQADNVTDMATFITCGSKVHDLAIAGENTPGAFHHAAFLQENWDRVLRCADIYSMNKLSVDMGPSRHGISRATTVYGFDPSGNRVEQFCGGYAPYPDYHPITWTHEEAGPALMYHQRSLDSIRWSVT